MADIRRLVGTRVRELRTSQRLTQEQLGERAGLSYKFIGEVERGFANPTIETLAGIARALGVTVVDLVTVDAPAVTIGHFSPRDMAMVREVRDGLDTLLRRAGGSRRVRRAKR